MFNLNYKQKKEIPPLFVKNQNKISDVGLLQPGISYLVMNIGLIISMMKGQEVSVLREILNCFNNVISDKYEPGRFQEIADSLINEEMNEYEKKYLQIFKNIRNLFEKNREFYLENFSEILPQQEKADLNLLKNYMNAMSEITETHILSVICRIKIAIGFSEEKPPTLFNTSNQENIVPEKNIPSKEKGLNNT